MLEYKDQERRQVRKIRQCFIYERQYFMVESFANIDGCPSILRIETTGYDSLNNSIMIPPFLKVLKEVTDDLNYETKKMSELGYKMPTEDKEMM